MPHSPSDPSVNHLELESWLNQLIAADQFKDYAPNGLQVEGCPDIRRIVTGVTASQALIEHAIRNKADAVIVHHGWFWKNESPCVRGFRRRRMASVLAHDINLYGYHLPLDAHPTLGNNAQLARVLGLTPDINPSSQPVTFGHAGLVWSGQCDPCTADTLAQRIHQALDRQPLVVGPAERMIRRVAWCTGGAQSMLQDAIDHGVDAYITGEASEQNFHMANEADIVFVAAGHHATERYGIQALGNAIHNQFGIPVDFIDLDNPI